MFQIVEIFFSIQICVIHIYSEKLYPIKVSQRKILQITANFCLQDTVKEALSTSLRTKNTFSFEAIISRCGRFNLNSVRISHLLKKKIYNWFCLNKSYIGANIQCCNMPQNSKFYLFSKKCVTSKIFQLLYFQ